MKIPDSAKKVFKGVIYDVYHWEQEQFDGSLATYEMLKRPDTAQVLVVQDGMILLSKEEQPGKDPFYTLFGGRCEEGEDALTAAKRELKEETGLEASDWKPYVTYRPSSKIEWTVHLFLAQGVREVSAPMLDPGERVEILRCSFETFIEIVLSDQFRDREFAFDLCKRLYRGEKEALKTSLGL